MCCLQIMFILALMKKKTNRWDRSEKCSLERIECIKVSNSSEQLQWVQWIIQPSK